MIEHLVLFRLKPEAGDDTVQAILDGLSAMPAGMPIIRELRCGRNFSERGQGYGVALRVRLDNREDLAAYAVHPVHVALVESLIKPNAESIVVADYETE